MQGDATMEEMEEMEESHQHDQIVPLDLNQLKALTTMNSRFHVKITPDKNYFSLDSIPMWIDKALQLKNPDECAECFTVLCKFARADESKKTGLAILGYCCKLSPTNSHKALDMLMESEFLYNLMREHASERSLLLDWICKQNLTCQATWWIYVSRMWSDDVEEFANILNGDGAQDILDFRHVKSMLPAMQPLLGNDVVFNEFIASLLYEIGDHHCERTALFLMKSWAGDLAEELTRWLLLPDSPEKWNVFSEGQKPLPITWDGLPNGFGPIKQRNGREQALSHVFETRILTYDDNDENAWSIQQIRQWLIVCYDQPNHRDSYFFKCWLRDQWSDLDSTRHLLCWRPGCQHLILQLLEYVFECKIEHETEAKKEQV